MKHNLLGLLGLSVSLGLSSCAFEQAGHEELSPEEMGELFQESYDNLKADTATCSGITPPDNGVFGKKIALTFDDGPNAQTTPGIMNILRAHNAPATFFINGSRVTGSVERGILTEMVADPLFTVANHTFSHPKMTSLSSSSANAQIDDTTAVIVAAGETPKYFRFPFGASSCSLNTKVQSRGYAVVGWHMDSADWCYASGSGTCKASTFREVPDAYRSNMKGYVMSQVAGHQGGILLFHDIHKNTRDNLETLLTAMEAAGYSFVALSDMTVFPRLNGKIPGFTGDVCSTAADCGSGFCHSAGFCSTTCAGTCADQAGKASTFCIDDPSTTRADGMCVSKASTLNANCATLTRTESRDVARYVGTSGASAARALVCAPRATTAPAPVTPGFIGDHCSTDAECAFTPGAFCHPAGFCSLGCEGYCPDKRGKAGTFCTSDPSGDVAGGMCVSKSQSTNRFCSDVTGTTARSVSRYRGASGAPSATTTACVP